MNKYIIIIVVIVVVIAGGAVYRAKFLPEEEKFALTGVDRNITITTTKNRWMFEPEIIEINRGDKVILKLVNEDSYDHGIGIDFYGIAQRMPANSEVITEFIAKHEGEFPFYCSVPCGEGIVDGKKRSHFDMLGKMHVKGIISETK